MMHLITYIALGVDSVPQTAWKSAHWTHILKVYFRLQTHATRSQETVSWWGEICKLGSTASASVMCGTSIYKSVKGCLYSCNITLPARTNVLNISRRAATNTVKGNLLRKSERPTTGPTLACHTAKYRLCFQFEPIKASLVKSEWVSDKV